MSMLGLGTQVVLAAISAPTAVRKLRTKSTAWLVVYLVAAALLLGLVAKLILTYRKDLVALVLDYVLPRDWHFAGQLLIERFFAQQEQAVVTNAAIVGSLLVVQLLLFPVKEMLSASVEKEARLVDEPVAEHPLWFQAWEEIKLFLFMIAAQGTIFWIGYSNDPTRASLATFLSYMVLFASVAIDFLAPVLQRHKQTYSSIIKTLLAHPLLSFGFGAVFALPAILAAKAAAANPEWGFATQLGVQFGGQVLGIALAAVGGTVAGARLLPHARTRPQSSRPVRLVAWVALLTLLFWNGYRFGAVGRSLHHKSQILKCEYAIDWSSFDAEAPSAVGLALGLGSDAVKVGVSFEVTITNPTSVDLEIEDNHLDVMQKGQLIAQTKLPRLRVPAGTSEKVRIEFPLTIKPSQIMRIRELITTKDWSMTLWLQVADGFDFPIYLLDKT